MKLVKSKQLLDALMRGDIDADLLKVICIEGLHDGRINQFILMSELSIDKNNASSIIARLSNEGHITTDEEDFIHVTNEDEWLEADIKTMERERKRAYRELSRTNSDVSRTTEKVSRTCVPDSKNPDNQGFFEDSGSAAGLNNNNNNKNNVTSNQFYKGELDEATVSAIYNMILDRWPRTKGGSPDKAKEAIRNSDLTGIDDVKQRVFPAINEMVNSGAWQNGRIHSIATFIESRMYAGIDIPSNDEDDSLTANEKADLIHAQFEEQGGSYIKDTYDPEKIKQEQAERLAKVQELRKRVQAYQESKQSSVAAPQISVNADVAKAVSCDE